MKLFLVLALGIVTNAFAFPNQVECSGKLNGQKLKITVEQGGFGDRWEQVDAKIVIGTTVSNYKVRGSQFGSTTYSYYNDNSFDLRVDYWPDSRPQWGSFYDGTFIGSASEGRRIRNLRCRFPNAI